MSNKLIEVKNIAAGYEDLLIIRDINLDIFENDFIGIIGPNGGGKTTLIKVILGLLKPMEGSVTYFDGGEVVPNLSIGYLPQRNNIDHKFPITVEEVVSSGLMSEKSLFKSSLKAAERDMVRMVLEQTGMYEKRNHVIGALSGGQMQRVMLARAIVNQPKLLVLDEPNSYIDKRFEDKLYQLLRVINETTTILMVSHEVTSLVGMVNRTISVDKTLHPASLDCPYHHPKPAI